MFFWIFSFQKLAQLVLLSLSTSMLPLHTALPVLLVSYIMQFSHNSYWTKIPFKPPIYKWHVLSSQFMNEKQLPWRQKQSNPPKSQIKSLLHSAKEQWDHNTMNDNIKLHGFLTSCGVWNNTKRTPRKFDPFGLQIKWWGAGAPPELGPLTFRRLMSTIVNVPHR